MAHPSWSGPVEVPEPYLPHSMSFLHDMSQNLARARLLELQTSAPTRQRRFDYRQVPPSGESLPRPAVKGLKRLARLDADIARLHRSVLADTDSLARQFDEVLGVLRERGHVEGWSLTSSGRRLSSLYHEADLLIVEALEEGAFDGLTAPEFAALASVFGFDERRSSRTRTEHRSKKPFDGGCLPNQRAAAAVPLGGAPPSVSDPT